MPNRERRGEVSKPALKRQAKTKTKASVARKEWRQVLFSGEDGFIRTPVYDDELLRSGHEFKGPAIIEGKATTVVVHPWQHVRVDPYRNFMLTG